MDLNQQWNEKKSQFFSLWRSCQLKPVDDRVIEAAWNIVTESYSEPHRFYHTRHHILECLKQFEHAIDCIEDQKSVEMAVWFHDIILDPGAKDNEQKSMLLFRELAEDYFTADYIETVSLLILSTMHIAPPATNDEACIQDIDISSFAYDWNDFLVDVDNLFLECPHQSTSRFNQAKQIFYEMLLDRDQIFTSDYFYKHCEEKARANIERYLKKKR